MTLSDRLQRANWLLLGLALLLTVVGIFTLSAAAGEDGPPWAWLQVRWTLVALAGTLVALTVPYKRVVAAFPLFYAAGVAGLVVVLLVGTGRGAVRWIDLGAFRMQPSEFMKPVLVVTLAGYVRYRQAYKRFAGLSIPFALTLVPVALVMRQPDLGTALLLIPILFVSLFAAGAKPGHLGLVTLAGIAAGFALYFVPGLMEPYQKERVTSFLAQDGGGEAGHILRRQQGFQLEKSKVAIASGGFLGADGEEAFEDAIAGFPERHTDFVFSTFAARYGLVGVSLLLLAWFALLATILSTAAKAREPSGRLLAVGVFTLFAVQVLVNLGMTMGLLPVVGVTLPFFSYGGSSLLSSFLCIGLVLSVDVHPEIELGVGDFD